MPPQALDVPEDLIGPERDDRTGGRLAFLEAWAATEGGYWQIQRTRPRTLAVWAERFTLRPNRLDRLEFRA
jgi:hypothetical protein